MRIPSPHSSENINIPGTGKQTIATQSRSSHRPGDKGAVVPSVRSDQDYLPTKLSKVPTHVEYWTTDSRFDSIGYVSSIRRRVRTNRNQVFDHQLPDTDKRRFNDANATQLCAQSETRQVAYQRESQRIEKELPPGDKSEG